MPAIARTSHSSERRDTGNMAWVTVPKVAAMIGLYKSLAASHQPPTASIHVPGWQVPGVQTGRAHASPAPRRLGSSRAAGMAADTTFHDLRHTFASTALAEGVPISEVSRWLGHKSITTTVDLYGHLVPEASGRARDALDRAFASAGMCPESAPTA